MPATTLTLQKKICMLGGFSVGKTSLVKRFVASVFSETYLTTVGVKIDKKTSTCPIGSLISSCGTSRGRTIFPRFA